MSSQAAPANEERASLLQLLQRNAALYLATLENVSSAQAAFKPGPERWSIAEVAEHVATTEQSMYQMAVAASPSTEESDRRMDDRIHRFAADRSRTFAAPEGACPCGRFGSVEEATAAFRSALQNAIEYLQQTQGDLRCLRLIHPAAGSIDVYQNLLIMAYHPERHAKQIVEIKSSEAYPK